jgi:hypothetical protein
MGYDVAGVLRVQEEELIELTDIQLAKCELFVHSKTFRKRNIRLAGQNWALSLNTNGCRTETRLSQVSLGHSKLRY